MYDEGKEDESILNLEREKDNIIKSIEIIIINYFKIKIRKEDLLMRQLIDIIIPKYEEIFKISSIRYLKQHW